MQLMNTTLRTLEGSGGYLEQSLKMTWTMPSSMGEQSLCRRAATSPSSKPLFYLPSFISSSISASRLRGSSFAAQSPILQYILLIQQMLHEFVGSGP